MQRDAFLFVAAALIASARDASAQTAPTAPAAQTSEAPAAQTAATAETTPAPVEPAEPAPDPPRPESPVPCDQVGSDALMAAARAHFNAGQTHVEAGEWNDALQELRTALAFYDSPNSRYLLGSTLAGLQRYDEAYNEFDSTIEQAARCAQADQTRGRAPRYTETVAGALRDRDALTPRVALLGVRVPDDAPAGLALQVNGLPLQRRFWNRLRAYPPGDARVLGEATGYARFVGTTPLDPRRAQWLDVVMTREAPVGGDRASSGSRGILRPVGFALAGVGGAALIAGTAMFFAGRGQFSTLRDECGGACPLSGDYPNRIDSGQSLEAAGIGLFWGGVAVAATGVVLVLVGGRNASPATTQTAPRPSLGARFQLGGAGLEVVF